MTRRMLCSVLLALVALVCQARVYNVKDFGAKGDGKTLDHVAINKTIETATSEGGGQVVVPAGTYLCGSIRLKSNIDLHLMAGAKMKQVPVTCFNGMSGTKRSAGMQGRSVY